jgi:hypothetical protein
MMKERPILFSGSMVRAILAGQKTQTRRVMKPQPDYLCANSMAATEFTSTRTARDGECVEGPQMFGVFNDEQAWACPYGRPGDRLWVRETFCNIAMPADAPVWLYRADGIERPKYVKAWKPSIFCTRAASRIMLEVKAVRAERLHQISEADAVAEGCVASDLPDRHCSAVETYRALWDSINGAGAWQSDQFVWVIEFAMVKGGTEA